MTDPQGRTTSYAYDALDRLTTLTDPISGSFGFAYDALGRRTQLARSNGVVTTYGYDALSRLLAVLHSSGRAGSLDGSRYTYDPAGNRLTNGSSLRQYPINWSYDYDSIYQLTQAAQSGAPTESYTYDAVGNRLSSTVAPSPSLPAVSTAYAYDPLSNSLARAAGTIYGYYANGNTAYRVDASALTRYGYDYENRLTSVTLPSGTSIDMSYDPFGRRIRKGATAYVYDGPNILEELDSAGGVVARYTQGLGIDEPLAAIRGRNTWFYHADALGSITSLTTPRGTPAGFYAYDSFGNVVASGGTFALANPFLFTGRERDAESGLYYYRARYYDAKVGRFLSEDPLRFLGDRNFYRYVFNSPTNAVDPFGLLCTCTYSQLTGAIRCMDEEGWVVAEGSGYAGFGPGVNNPDLQGVENTGPLPRGSYTIGPPTARKGPLTLPLWPRRGTDLLGRPGGFLIHGDNSSSNRSASEGCVIQGRNIRQAIAACGGGILEVKF